VFTKIRRGFDAAGVAQSDEQILRVMNELFSKPATKCRQLEEVPPMPWR
jgi:hypothetical protein